MSLNVITQLFKTIKIKHKKMLKNASKVLNFQKCYAVNLNILPNCLKCCVFGFFGEVSNASKRVKNRQKTLRIQNLILLNTMSMPIYVVNIYLCQTRDRPYRTSNSFWFFEPPKSSIKQYHTSTQKKIRPPKRRSQIFPLS